MNGGRESILSPLALFATEQVCQPNHRGTSYTLPDVCGSSTLRRVWSVARTSGTNAVRLLKRTLEPRAGEGVMRLGPFLLIAILLLLAWGGGFLMFHVASGLIHLLLVLAILSFIFHFITGRRVA